MQTQYKCKDQNICKILYTEMTQQNETSER